MVLFLFVIFKIFEQKFPVFPITSYRFKFSPVNDFIYRWKEVSQFPLGNIERQKNRWISTSVIIRRLVVLLWLGVCVKSLQSCPTLCDPMNCSPPGSFVHGILQARILEWVAVFSSRGSSKPQDRTRLSEIEIFIWQLKGLPGCSGSKESACSARDLGSVHAQVQMHWDLLIQNDKWCWHFYPKM